MNLRVAVLVAAAVLAPALAAKNLQIHVFDVGQAASELIVFPSGYSILVDCGEVGWSSSANAQYVGQRVQEILGKKSVDVLVISHMHLDHIGYAGKGGIWHLVEQQGFKFGKIVDRDSGVWKDKDGDGTCNKDTEIVWHNIGVLSNTFTLWLCYVTNPANSKVYPLRENAVLCSQDQIAPPDKGASVTITTHDGLGVKRKDGTPVSGDHSAMAIPPNENDFSVGLLIKWGKFTYSTAGDLDGQYYADQGYEYNDEESVVAKRIGQVDVLHVNHHGSSHSTNQKWINTLMPTASVVTLGTNNSYGHPDQGTLDRLLNAGDVFLTEKGSPDRDYGEAVIAENDVLIDVSADGSSFKIATPAVSKTYKSKGAVAPTCAL